MSALLTPILPNDIQNANLLQSHTTPTSTSSDFSPSVSVHNIIVDTSHPFPNTNCTIICPHIYDHLKPTIDHPPNIPYLPVGHFQPGLHPFPHSQCLGIGKPSIKLYNHQQVYIDYYGGAVVKLQEFICEEGRWSVYRCIDGMLDIMIVEEENKCKRSRWGFQNICLALTLLLLIKLSSKFCQHSYFLSSLLISFSLNGLAHVVT